MTDTQNMEEAFELLYDATAKPLYNLTLYTIGDQPIAERILTDIFVDVFYTISDQADSDLFKKKCIKSLYRRIRKIRIEPEYDIGCIAQFKIKGRQQKPEDIKRAQLFCILRRLSFEERYIILLFCWQRLSLKQIAETLCLPKFLVRKCLHAITAKAAAVSET